MDFSSMSDEELERIANGGVVGATRSGMDFSKMSDEELERIARGDSPLSVSAPKPGEYGAIRANGVQMRPEDFSGMGERGGVESALLNIQRDTGIVSDYDGTWGGGLKNALYATGHAGAGRAFAGAMNKNLQFLAKGTDADGVPLEQLPDDEVDYLMDSAGANGAGGWFRRFLGAGASGAWRGEDNIMRRWDETDGAKIEDPAERKRARVEYAREIARGMIGQTETSKQRAAAELEGREETTAGAALRGLIEQGGYTLPFIAGSMLGGPLGSKTVGSFILAGGLEGADRYNELRADRFAMDTDGNIGVEAAGDEVSDAAGKALLRGIMSPTIEMVGGKAASALGGKLLGATIGKVPLFRKAGNALAATKAGRAVDAFAKRLNFLGRYTGMQGMPEEMAEELEDQVLDAAFGIDRRESEKRDGETWTDRAGESFSDFFKGENLKELATSMLLMQVIGGAGGHVADRIRSRHIDGVLREVVGVDDSELKYYTADEKMAAFKAWADGLTEDQIADKFKAGAKQVNRMVSEIRRNVGENQFAETDADAPKFNAPMRTNGDGQTLADENGNPIPDFQEVTDEAGRPVMRLYDAESGVTIDRIDMGDGDVQFRVTDAAGRVRAAETYQQAVKRANQMLSGEYRSSMKRHYLESLTRPGRILSGVDVVAGDTLRDVMDEIGARYGEEAAASVRRRIGNPDEDTSGQSFRYVLPDGRSGVAFVLGKIGSVEDMATAAMHEAGRHAGLDMLFDTPQKKADFLKKIDGKGIDTGAAARAMTPEQRRSFEGELTDIQQRYGLASRDDVFKTPEAVEELFAYFTENEFGNASLKNRFVAGLRSLYRDMFDADLSYNDADLLAMAGELNRRMRENTEAGRMTYRSAQTRLGREEAGDIENRRQGRRVMREQERQRANAPAQIPYNPTAPEGTTVPRLGYDPAQTSYGPIQTPHPQSWRNQRNPGQAWGDIVRNGPGLSPEQREADARRRAEADRLAQGHDVDPETGGEGQLEDTEMPSGQTYLPNSPSRIRREVERQRRYAQRQLERFVDNRDEFNRPVQRTDEERRLAQEARERRIMDKYPHLWMKMSELMPDTEDEDILIACTRALREDAMNGTPGRAESDALVSYALERLENGEDLTDAEVRGIEERGFTGQMLVNEFGYRKRGDRWVYTGEYGENDERTRNRRVVEARNTQGVQSGADILSQMRNGQRGQEAAKNGPRSAGTGTGATAPQNGTEAPQGVKTAKNADLSATVRTSDKNVTAKPADSEQMKRVKSKNRILTDKEVESSTGKEPDVMDEKAWDAWYEKAVVVKDRHVAEHDMGNGNTVEVSRAGRDKDGDPTHEAYVVNGVESPVYTMGGVEGDKMPFFVNWLGVDPNDTRIESLATEFMAKRGRPNGMTSLDNRKGRQPRNRKDGHAWDIDEAGPQFENFRDAHDFGNLPEVKRIIEEFRSQSEVNKETTNETGNGTAEAPAQPEQGAAGTAGAETAGQVSGTAQGTEAQTAGVVKPKTQSGENLRKINAERAEKRRQAQREIRALHEKFINGKQMNPASLFAFRDDGGRLLSMPPRKRTYDRKARKFRYQFVGDDPAVGALNRFFDGIKGDEYQLWMERIFGDKAKRRSTNTHGNDEVLADIMNFGRALRDEGMTLDEQMADKRFNDFDGLLAGFAKEWADYERWKENGALTDEERRLAELEAQDEEAAAYTDEELARRASERDAASEAEAEEDAAIERQEEEWDRAEREAIEAEARGADERARRENVASRATNGDAEDVERKFREARDMAQNLLDVLHRGRQEQLNLSRERYDGMKAAIADARPVKIKGVENGTAGIVKVGDRWRVVDLQSGFYFGDGASKADAIAESERRIGLAKERGDLERIIQEGRDAFAAARSKYDADASKSDNAAPDFALESVTPEQLKRERDRQAQRDEIRRRQEAELRGSAGETGQTLLDLGGAEGEDLFNRTQRQTEQGGAQAGNAASTARERLASVYAEWAEGEALPAWTDRLTDAEAKEYADLIDAALNVEGDDGGRAYRAVTDFEKRHEAASPAQTRETAPAGAQDETRATETADGEEAAQATESADVAPQATSEDARSVSAQSPATQSPATFNRGDTVMLRNADGQYGAVTFVKDNGDGTATVQRRTANRVPYLPAKVENLTVRTGDLAASGMKRTLTEAEREAERRGRAEDKTNGMDVGEANVRWRRAAPDYAPKKTYHDVTGRYLYKTMRLVDGHLEYPMAGTGEAVPVGEWLVAEDQSRINPRTGKRETKLRFGSKELGRDGRLKSNSGTAAPFPGFHAGTIPYMAHIGLGGTPGQKHFQNADYVWVEIDAPMDRTQEYADRINSVDPDNADKAMRGVIPLDGMYFRKTNPNMKGKWGVLGQMKIVRVLSDDQVDAILDREHPNRVRMGRQGGGRFNAQTMRMEGQDLANWNLEEEEQRFGEANVRWRRGDSNLDNLRRLMSGKGSAEVRWRRAIPELQKAGMYLGTMSEHKARMRTQAFPDGSDEKEGAESVVIRVGDRVVKYRDARNLTQRDADKIQWHNELFGDRTPYDVRGLSADDSWSGDYRPPRIVLEQPYVEIREGGGAEARRRLVEDLRRRFGAENVTVKGDPASERMEIDAGPYHISDLKDLNIGIDERTGDYAVWDANIEKRNGADAGGGADVRWRRVTPAEDAAYMGAVERGDMETAERMVREAADRAGYGKIGFHGTTYKRGKFTTFQKGSHIGSEVYQALNRIGVETDGPMAKEQTDLIIEDLRRNGKDVLSLRVKLNNPLRISDFGDDWSGKDFVRRLYGEHPELFSNAEWAEMMKDPSRAHQMIEGKGYDGLVYDNGSEGILDYSGDTPGRYKDDGTYIPNDSYIPFHPSQIKSAESVTRDDAGNVIPLSQRFNPDSADIRWRRTYTPNPAARDLADRGPILRDADGNIMRDADGNEVRSTLTQRERDEINSVMPVDAEGRRRSTSRDRQERAAREQASRDAFARAFHNAGTWQRVGMLLDKNTRKDAWRAVKESAIRKMQDAGIDLRKYEVRRFERQFGKPMSRWTNAEKEQFVSQSTYYAMDRAYGRKENLSLKLNQDYVKPLEKQIAENGLDEAWTDERGEQNIGADGKPLSKLDVYLMALHGGEYNRMIAERTARAEDGPVLDGSGRSTEYWERQLARFRNEGFDRKAAEAVRLVHEMNKAALQQMVDSGRISQKQADKWNELSPNYVPLRNSDAARDLFEQLLFGGDIDEQTYRKAFSGTEYNHAAGRRSLADSPVINSIQQAEWAIARSMDNESRRSLAAQVRADPRMGTVVMQMSQSDFQEAQRQIAVFTQMEANGTITPAQRDRLARLKQNVADTIAGNRLLPRRRMLNQNSEVQSVIDVQGLEDDPNVGWVAFKENGDTKYIKLGHHELVDANGNATGNMDELTGNRIAKFVNGQSFVKLGGVMRFVRNLSRGFGMLRTSLSPTFLFSNFLADNGQALRNVFHSMGAGAMRTFEGHAMDMGKNGARASALRYLRGQLDPNRYAIDRFTKEWAEAGGQIGGFATESFGDIDERMAASLRRMQRRLSRGKGGWANALKDGARALGERFQELNSAIEMATRISAYATMRENGMGVNDAVSYARDVTVNFNRKGEWTPIFNALYVFSNANIQDMQRTGMTFTGSRAAKLNGTLFVLGLLSAALGFGQDEPDDEAEGKETWENASEHRKQNGISFRVGGKVISLPLRGLARMPYYAGHKAFEALTGRRDAKDVAADIGSFMFSAAADPLSTTSSLAQSVAPSILRPAVELIENKSFTGAPIHRTKMSETQVASEMGRQSTSDMAVWLARTLNSLTGGNRNRSGLIDVFPETLEQIGRGLAGTLGTDLAKAYELTKDILTFQTPATRDVPFVSRVASDMEKNSRRYHEAVTDFERDQKEYKDLAQEDPSVMAALRRNSPWFREGNEMWYNELDSLRKLNKKLMVEETKADGKEREALNELRMKTQGLFLWRLKHAPESDAPAKRAEYGQRNRLIDRMLRGRAAARKQEERHGKK